MAPLQPAPAGTIPFEAHDAASTRRGALHARVSSRHEPTLYEQLHDECEAMARHALQHGLRISPETIARLAVLLVDDACLNAAYARELAAIHARLAQLVAPATPQGIVLLDAHRRRPPAIGIWGPVLLIRVLTLTAVGFLAAVIASGLSAEVSGENLERGLLASSGATLLMNMVFLMCCAGLGASFATLFHAHRYIANSSYDPKFDASYLARLILGLIAGLILVEILPANLFADGETNGFGKPALAMLGGFSASAVHRLLQRLVDALETVVRGDPGAQLHAELAGQRAHAAAERLQAQGEIAQRLFALQHALDGNTPPDTLRQQIATLTQTMLSGDGIHAVPSDAPSA